jgi:small-conductance mechanosensitive channel
MPTEFREIFLWLRTSGLRLLLIAAASVLLVRLLSSLVDRILHLMANGSGATISEAEKRARTMASLLRTVGTAFIIVVAVLMALREIGLDITPLLAGAGVAGLAIGFGAQGLIKDVIAGFFILMEDQFHVGRHSGGRGERPGRADEPADDDRARSPGHRPFHSQR